MDQNKTGRYLKYAIGEILLVVIGILIALQINNWNQNLNDREQETIFLMDFKSDLEKDVEILNGFISTNTNRINTVDKIYEILSSDQKKFSDSELLSFYDLHFNISSESYFIPEKSTINQFQAGTNSHLISSKELKDQLFRYYSSAERLENNMEKSLQLYQHHSISTSVFKMTLSGDILKLIQGSSFDRPPLDLKELNQDSDYHFALSAKKNLTKTQNGTYRRTIAEAEQIIELIDGELSN